MLNNKNLELFFLASLSNMLLFGYWLKTGLFSSEVRYYFYSKPTVELIIGLSLLLIFFFIFYLFSKLLINLKLEKILNFIYLILFILVLDILRTASNFFSLSYIIENKFIFLFILLISVFVTYNYFNNIINLIKFFFIILSPFIIVILLNIFNTLFILNWENNKDNISKKNYAMKKDKIILLIFDELDYRVLKENKYENFNKILNTSNVYTNAFPSGDATLDILPSILTGLDLPDDTREYDFQLNDIVFKYEDVKKQISKEPNLFKIINDENYKIGLIGIYHRYCNIFFKELNDCHDLNDEQYTIRNLGISKYLIYTLIDIIPGSARINIFKNINSQNFNSSDLPKLRIENIKKFQTVFSQLINKNDFIFIHIPLPHAPWIFFDNDYNVGHHDQFNEGGYYDNMNLTDKFLGKIIEYLKEKEIFENTTIFLASDHGWRNGDDFFIGSNKKKLNDRGGDVLLSVKRKNQSEQKIINEKIINYELFYLIKKEL